jgi:hypothetical protein
VYGIQPQQVPKAASQAQTQAQAHWLPWAHTFWQYRLNKCNLLVRDFMNTIHGGIVLLCYEAFASYDIA